MIKNVWVRERNSKAMKTIAIITARGGSKRIPGKNIKPFCGKPILAYSIEAALQAGCFDTVMVSTDDEKIAAIAREYGAEVPFFRSAENSDDFSTTRDVVAEVLKQYEQQGMTFEYVCCIYPTAPFITAERLAESMELLRMKQADSVLPVVQFSFPPQRCVVLEEGRAVFKWPENMLTRSQDLEPFYHDCGQFYCLNVKSFEEQNLLFMKKTYPVILDELEVQDIDNETDWKLAELKYQLLKESAK